MNIGIITVRDRNYHPNGRLLKAAAEKGHQGLLIHPYKVWPHATQNGLGFEGELDVKDLDAVMPRQGATIGESSLTLLHHFSCLEMPMVNGFNAVCIARSQIMTLQTLAADGLPVPETLFTNSEEGFHGAVPLVGGYPVVAKQVSGRQGSGIYLVETGTQAEAILNDHMEPRTGILVQRYIQTPGRLDIRVMVIDGKAVGAMEMTPLEGDFRANFHLTRESRPFKITSSIEKLAVKAACAVGLDIAGVDMIVDRHKNMYLIEVNYAPGFKGLEKATGLDIAGCMIDCAISRGRKTEPQRPVSSKE
ncbi:MAG: RimK family alpha-L-glutamate ligase [Thermodesulfobacteriota bacterium]